MRAIDIDQVEPPAGWQARAIRALNELRAEVEQAETAALADGRDPSAARKAAITLGLSLPARTKIWKDLTVKLGEISKGKCWYSESRNPTADPNVDHFRPKNGVEGDPTHEGYWWLAFTLRNFRYSSQWCNQPRNDKVGGTSGGKWHHFSLCPGSVRARQEEDDIELENPELLDPIDPSDWKLVTFRPDGHPIPARQPGTEDFQRAETSINVYHLHCRELVNERRAVAANIRRIVQDLERLQPKIDDPKLRAQYKQREMDLLRAINRDAEYSAAALAFTRAEVFTDRAGRQVKREWLEDILNSNP